MAPEESDRPVDDGDATLQELVFSCCMCQATVSDVYVTVESNHGFHSGSSSEDGIVTKMWITSCSHVICAKHLENGAVPFHPKDQKPRAPCPKCVKDARDETLKDLFSIQGLDEGEYDRTIPDIWMHCPAMKLDDSMEGMDAVRFQYMALCHYGREVRKHWKAALQKQSAMETAYTKERKARRQLQSEQLELQTRLAALQKVEAKLKKWEDRKPVINHYLNAFSEMTMDNERMRGQLIELGHDVPLRKYIFEPSDVSKSGPTLPEGHRMEHERNVAPPSRIHASQDQSSSSARKRKRDESFNNVSQQDVIRSANLRRSSRDLMPPPLPRPRPGHQSMAADDRPSTRRSGIVGPGPYTLVQPHDSHVRKPTAQESQIEHHEDYITPPGYTRPQRSRLQSPGHQQQPEMSHYYQRPEGWIGPAGYMPDSRAEINQYDPVSIAQLSLQSSQDHGMRADDPGERRWSAHPDHYASQSAQAFFETQAPQHLRTERVPVYHSEPRTGSRGRFYERNSETKLPRAQMSAATRTSQVLPRSQSGVASSPFFKRGPAASRSDPMRRPLARGNDIQLQYTTQDRSHHNPGPPTDTPLGFAPRDHVGGLPLRQRPHDQQSYFQHPRPQSRLISSRKENALIPQTPRNSQGLLRRPDLRPPSVSHSSIRQEERPSYSRRITLPPLTGPPMSMGPSQDEVMSHIPGVRGFSSHRGFQNHQPSAPNYNVARTLFSAAGPRQSLRR